MKYSKDVILIAWTGTSAFLSIIVCLFSVDYGIALLFTSIAVMAISVFVIGLKKVSLLELFQDTHVKGSNALKERKYFKSFIYASVIPMFILGIGMCITLLIIIFVQIFTSGVNS